jgi:hypothetical protein
MLRFDGMSSQIRDMYSNSPPLEICVVTKTTKYLETHPNVTPTSILFFANFDSGHIVIAGNGMLKMEVPLFAKLIIIAFRSHLS